MVVGSIKKFAASSLSKSTLRCQITKRKTAVRAAASLSLLSFGESAVYHSSVARCQTFTTRDLEGMPHLRGSDLKNANSIVHMQLVVVNQSTDRFKTFFKCVNLR